MTPTLDRAVTLAVPTPVPGAAVSQPTARPTVSALQRIRDEGMLRVGVLYNNPPLSSLSERGRVVGYEADLARGIAEQLGVDITFVQVTRQNAVASLLADDVDILMAAVVHRREAESELAFTQTYFPGGQMFLVRADGAIQSPGQVNGQRVGAVQGTASERALGRAISSGGLHVTPELFLTLDQAVGALGSGNVAAVVADRVSLIPVLSQIAGARLLDEVLEPEPYAIALRRHDGPLRYLLNRALQALYTEGRVDESRRTWFPNLSFTLEFPVWEGVAEDTRGLADFDTALVYPEPSLVARIQAGEAVRVAGLDRNPQSSPFVHRLESFYQAVAQEMASRWGVAAEFTPDSAASALELVASGEAHLAIGVTPRWTGPYEVAYSAPLIVHGDRLMIPAGSAIEGFADLRGRWVGIFASEPGTADRVNELADEVRTAVNIFTIINDEDAVYSMLVDQNADVVFGDSLRLLPLVEANGELVKLTDRWYSREYYAIAVPRNDPDMLSLVEITLQDMVADGTFAQLWASTLAFGEPTAFEHWPGARGQFLGVRTGIPD